MRNLATIRRIDKLTPIKGADRIVAAKVGGWQTVVGIDDFKEGDLCVFFEIDSFLPVDVKYFTFLEPHAVTYNEKRGVRVRTMRFKKTLSQGLALPLSTFDPDFALIEDTGEEEGTDFTEFLGVQLWERVLPENAIGMIPETIRRTHQPRIQNIWDDLFDQDSPFCLPSSDSKFEVSEKLEGSSMTIYKEKGRTGVCSQRVDLKPGSGRYWNTVERLELLEKLSRTTLDYAIQGELIGPGIQGNHYKLDESEFRVFDVWDITAQEYLTSDQRQNLCAFLDLPHAPIIAADITIEEFPNLDVILAYADGKSAINPMRRREGLVFKNLEAPEHSFKVISNDYLLKHG